MTQLEAIRLLGATDATLFTAATLVVAAIGLWRNGRPRTKTRLMDAALTTLLLVFVGIRYAVLGALVLIAPTALVAAHPGPIGVALLAGLYLAVAAFGLAAYRGPVGWRVAGALIFAAMSLAEGLASLFLVDAPLVMRLDTGLAIAIACGALVLAAFHWSHRTATPNPLGGDARPFDY